MVQKSTNSATSKIQLQRNTKNKRQRPRDSNLFGKFLVEVLNEKEGKEGGLVLLEIRKKEQNYI